MTARPIRLIPILALAFAPVSVAQDDHQALRDSVRAAALPGFESQALVGLAYGVVLDGEIAFTGGLGWEDREGKIAVSDQTRFRWASISKPLTAVAAMQLVEAERLDLDRDVREYVAEFPEKAHTITARQLLCHQGGIVHYTNGELVRTRREYDVEHPFADVVLALDTFKESPLVAQPGTRYSYTTHGYILLGAVVQRAGEQPYWDQVRTRICEPLGLATLRPDYQWEEIPHRAVGYRNILGKVVRSSDTDVSWKLPGGGYVSSVVDLAGFAAGMLGDELVSPDTKRTMWTRQKTSADAGTSYGLGFGVSRADGELVVSHSGSQEKTRTLMRIWPDQSRALVLMSNSEYAKLAPILEQIELVLPRATAGSGK